MKIYKVRAEKNLQVPPNIKTLKHKKQPQPKIQQQKIELQKRKKQTTTTETFFH